MDVGMGLLQRQRAVNDAVKEQMSGVHALTMKTWTPAQWAAKQAETSGDAAAK